MATGDSILEGLSGMQFSAADNPFGLGTVALATSLPKLINPAGNFGTNLGITLGGTLLTALMGYQARQTAADLSSKATNVGLNILSAKTPEEQKAIADASNEGFYGGEIQSKALNLVNALQGQQKVNEVAAQQAYDLKLKELQALTSDPGKQYTQQQLDMALGKIGAQGAQQRFTEADKAGYKAVNTILKGDIDARLGYLNADIKRKLVANLAADKVTRLANNEDPDVIEANQLAYTKALIDKAEQEQKQVYDLQKIEFDRKLTDSLKGGDLSAPDKTTVTKAQNVASIAYDIANYVDENIKTYPELYAGRNYSAANDNALKERLQMLRDEYKIYSTGAAAGKLEMALYDSVINGDWTAGLPSQLQNLRALADTLSQKSMTILQNANKSSSEIYSDIVTGFSNKKPVQYGTTIPQIETPTRPAPATIGGGLAGGLGTSAASSNPQLIALEAQKQQIVDAVNSGAMTFEAGKAQAQKIQAQILALQGGM
jgi:hypothetical protein